jgi:S-adenosylmethionine:tRNA ribosyltransferase-isomerase
MNQATPHPDLKVTDFDFHLPEELIAQQPPAERGTSRMLIVDRNQPGKTQPIESSFTDSTFANFPSLLNPGDLLVLNDSRVIPARLYARRANTRGKQEPSGQIEILLTSPAPDASGEGNQQAWHAHVWHALVRPGRKVRSGDRLLFEDAAGAVVLEAEVLSAGDFGARTIRFAPVADFFSILDRIGHMPLPPYIKRSDAAPDRDRYQTVFAAQRGSVAAPTAGLHFTPEILEAIHARGVEIAKVTLHVGLGTFAPLRVERLSEIRLHSEHYTLSAETASALNRARAENRRILAVGTTVVRTLEHCALTAEASGAPGLTAHTGETSIFLSPGHRFRIVQAILTNFHLPQSSLLMLVSAFAGRERILAAYAHAVREHYRFFSYGDCMLIS